MCAPRPPIPMPAGLSTEGLAQAVSYAPSRHIRIPTFASGK